MQSPKNKEVLNAIALDDFKRDAPDAADAATGREFRDGEGKPRGRRAESQHPWKKPDASAAILPPLRRDVADNEDL